MYALRRWAVRHARGLETLYRLFEPVLTQLEPVWRRLGYARVETPMRVVEQAVKGLLFDCQMCGQCALSSTGMSCSMNCPKTIRNGPCGGVRANGHCEVKPEMRCVWVEAWNGSQTMRNHRAIQQLQAPLDQRLRGTSSWLRIAREKSAPRG